MKAAKQTTPGPASHSEAEGVLSSTLLLVLAVRPTIQLYGIHFFHDVPSRHCATCQALHTVMKGWTVQTCR